ncbi:MAG: Transglutaminase [Chitinophagaceae bacterium]|nr:Transglutaminase [Chitinophagaceae bacterium]
MVTETNYQVVHTTEYVYDDTISLCHNIARLIPRSTPNQFCKKTNVRIDPQPDVMNEYIDFFGNKVLYFAIQHEHKKLTVTVSSVVSKDNTGPKMNYHQSIAWEEAKKLLSEQRPECLDAKQYIPETPMTESSPEIIAYTSHSFTPGRPLFDAVFDLMHRIHHDFEFKTNFTTIATPVTTVMHERKGVCQDFAHLAIACLRSLGLAARYVSGYIETLPSPGKEKLVGMDASHAWFSVFIPQTGWVDLDPTNNQVPADQHITIGWGRDYADITPLKGVILSSGKHKLNVSVDVKRVR